MELAHGTHTRSDTFTGNASNTTTTSTSGSNITDGATGASCARMTLATKISHDTASRLRCRTGAEHFPETQRTFAATALGYGARSFVHKPAPVGGRFGYTGRSPSFSKLT